MHPEVLVRMAADCVFNTQVRAGSICYLIAAGVVVQHRFKVEVVMPATFAAKVAERHHGSAGFLSNPCGGCDGCCRDAKKRCKDAVLAAIVLIGGIPDDPVGFEAANQPSKVIPVQGRAIKTLAGAGHDSVEQGIIMVAWHHSRFGNQGIKGTTKIQGAVMTTQ